MLAREFGIRGPEREERPNELVGAVTGAERGEEIPALIPVGGMMGGGMEEELGPIPPPVRFDPFRERPEKKDDLGLMALRGGVAFELGMFREVEEMEESVVVDAEEGERTPG